MYRYNPDRLRYYAEGQIIFGTVCTFFSHHLLFEHSEDLNIKIIFFLRFDSLGPPVHS